MSSSPGSNDVLIVCERRAVPERTNVLTGTAHRDVRRICTPHDIRRFVEGEDTLDPGR